MLCAADLVLGSELDLGVGQNDLAAALECTVDGQLCQSVADGSTVGGAGLLDGGLEQPHNGVGLSRVAVHVDVVDLLEVLVDLHAVGQVGVELDNRSHAVCGCAQIGDEGRIGEAVCLGNDHLGLVVLLLQGLDEQSRVADVGVAQDGIGISLLQSQDLRGQVGSVGAVVHFGHNIQTVIGCEQVDAADQLLTDGSLIGEDGDLLDLVAGLLLGVLQILQHIFHVDGVQRAQTEEVIVVLVVLVGQTVQRGDSGDHGDAVLLADLSHDLGNNGHMAAHNDVDTFLSDQALCLRLTGGCVACVVAADDFQHLAVHAACLVDLIHCEVDAAQDVLADGCVAAGHCVDGTDLDGVAGGSSCGAAGCCGSSAGGSGRAAAGGQSSCAAQNSGCLQEASTRDLFHNCPPILFVKNSLLIRDAPPHRVK